MGAIVLDASKVNSYVLPSLVKSKNTMQDAYSTSVNLKNSLPSSFKYRNLVSDIVNQIYKSKKEINDVNNIIFKKIDSAKNIEFKNDNRASKISSMVSKMGAVGGTIGGAAIGTATGGVVGAAVGGVVGNKVGKTIVNTGAKVASKVVSGVKKLGTSIVDGFKWVGSKITSAYKSATSWISDKVKKVSDWISEKFESVKNWTSQALKDTGAFVSKIGTTILSGLKTAWNWATDIENWKKVGASIANSVIALVKGLVGLVEAIGDLVVLLGAGIGTIGTALYDVGKGIVTGNLDWSATKGLWKGTKTVVAYQWTNKIFDALYDTKAGKMLDEYAYSPFKSDGMGCKILEGIGYVAGVIVLTICTFGVGGVATGATTTVSAGVTATTLAATATAAGIGKYTAEEWNKNCLSISYGGQDMGLVINYEKYLEIEKLKNGESTTITQQLMGEDGKPYDITFTITKNGETYSVADNNGNIVGFNGVVESSTIKGLLVGTVKGAWEGAQWYVGGKIGVGEFTKITGKIVSPVVKKLATSGIRVGLDTVTGVVETPFQSLVTMMSEGKSWNEAWQSQGGWDTVKMQAGIAGIASFGGEILDLTKFLRNADVSNNSIVSSTIDNTTVKLLEMDAEGVRNSIKEEIAQLDPSALDYAKKVDLLNKKEILEIELIQKMSQKSPGIEFAPKSMDLLSLSDQQQVKRVAQLVYDKAASQESTVTHAMKQLVDSETTLEGLDFKIKSLDSIQDKLARRLYQGYDVISAQNSINDSLRYTLIVNGNYEDTVLKKLNLLQKNGFTVVDLNNAWGKTTYQGLNVTLKNPNGLLVELQFHTPSSFNVKQVINHELYELSRNTSTSPEIRSISDRIQGINQELYVGRDTKFKFYNVNSLNEAINNFGIFKNYKTKNGYTDFLVENQKNIDTWNNEVAKKSKLGDYIQQYKGETITDSACYKIVNSKLRGTLFDDVNQTVKIIGTGGDVLPYTYSEFEKMIGCSIDEFKVKIDDSIKCLSDGISQCHLATNTELIRGVNWDTLENLFGISKQDSINVINSKLAAKGVWTEPGFMSACPSVADSEIPWIVSSKEIRLVMTCESTIDARIFPNDIGEKEVLLNYGQSFNINRAEYGSDGILYIYMDHIPK